MSENTRTVMCRNCNHHADLDRSKSLFVCPECGEKTMLMSDPK